MITSIRLSLFDVMVPANGEGGWDPDESIWTPTQGLWQPTDQKAAGRKGRVMFGRHAGCGECKKNPRIDAGYNDGPYPHMHMFCKGANCLGRWRFLKTEDNPLETYGDLKRATDAQVEIETFLLELAGKHPLCSADVWRSLREEVWQAMHPQPYQELVRI